MDGGTGGGAAVIARPRARRVHHGRQVARALVWLLAALLVAAGARQLLYSLYPMPYRAAVTSAGRRTGIDARLLAAVIRTESGFRPDAQSGVGALGLMQIEPSTGAWIAAHTGRRDFSTLSLLDPGENIAMGAWYLAELRDEFGGRLVPALAAYNAGRQPVQRWLATRVWSGSEQDIGAIPFAETRRFVARVLSSYEVYRMLYRS